MRAIGMISFMNSPFMYVLLVFPRLPASRLALFHQRVMVHSLREQPVPVRPVH